MKRGKEKLAAEDFEAAERLFCNCLDKTSSNESLADVLHSQKSEIMMLLLKTYRQQEKWSEAESLLKTKIALGARAAPSDNDDVLSDTLLLAEVLLKRSDYIQALLHGRRALKGYRRLGTSGTLGVEKALRLLIQIFHADGNIDEEDAYSTILSDFKIF